MLTTWYAMLSDFTCIFYFLSTACAKIMMHRKLMQNRGEECNVVAETSHPILNTMYQDVIQAEMNREVGQSQHQKHERDSYEVCKDTCFYFFFFSLYNCSTEKSANNSIENVSEIGKFWYETVFYLLTLFYTCFSVFAWHNVTAICDLKSA